MDLSFCYASDLKFFADSDYSDSFENLTNFQKKRSKGTNMPIIPKLKMKMRKCTAKRNLQLK